MTIAKHLPPFQNLNIFAQASGPKRILLDQSLDVSGVAGLDQPNAAVSFSAVKKRPGADHLRPKLCEESKVIGHVPLSQVFLAWIVRKDNAVQHVRALSDWVGLECLAANTLQRVENCRLMMQVCSHELG
nr:hypothetical protein [Tropicibacter sp. Alg240-R139]